MANDRAPHLGPYRKPARRLAFCSRVAPRKYLGLMQRVFSSALSTRKEEWRRLYYHAFPQLRQLIFKLPDEFCCSGKASKAKRTAGLPSTANFSRRLR